MSAARRGAFERTADAYAVRPAYPGALIEWLAERCPDLRGGLAVDVGSGPGMLARPLARVAGRVVAVDREGGMLAQVASAAGIHRLCARGEQLPVRSHSAALVAFAQSLHWMEPGLALAEAERVLAPGGAICVCWMEWEAPETAVEEFYCQAWSHVGATPPARAADHPVREGAAEWLSARCGSPSSWSGRLVVGFAPAELARFFLSREESGGLAGGRREAFAAWVRAEAEARWGGRIPYVFEMRARLARPAGPGRDDG